MGEIEKIQRVLPTLNTVQTPHRVGERSEKHGEGHQRHMPEDKIELTQEEPQEVEQEPVQEDTNVEGGLDLAV